MGRASCLTQYPDNVGCAAEAAGQAFGDGGRVAGAERGCAIGRVKRERAGLYEEDVGYVVAVRGDLAVEPEVIDGEVVRPVQAGIGADEAAAGSGRPGWRSARRRRR